MIRLVAAVAAVAVGVLLLTELSMRPSAEERLALAAIYGVAALITVVAFAVGRRLSTRLRTVGGSLQMVAVASVGVVAVAVVGAAQTMFLSVHDRNLVLAAVVLGVGLGSTLAIALGRQAGADLTRLQRAVDRVAAGNLAVRSRVARRDEVGRLAEAFDSMAAHLQAVEEERALFMAAVGHDLRTPLAALRATLEGAQDGVVDLDDRVVAAMGRDVAHLTRLVDDLFLFSRTEAGTVDLRPEPVDLVELADETVDVLAPLARERDVTMRLDAAAPVEVWADPWALGRALRNVVDNAIRFSPGGGTVTVSVAGGDRPHIVVDDEGPGFDPAIRDVAFDRFVRADPARRRDGAGAGLGLSIARGLVEAHGGGVSIEDGPGGRVRIRL